MKLIWVVQVRTLKGRWTTISAYDLRKDAQNTMNTLHYSVTGRILRYIPATLQKKRRKP